MRMLIEVVALEPPHYDEGVITIHCKKLLTAEAGEVDSVNAVFGGGFTQEKTCYCAECEKFFHGGVPCFAAGTRWSRETPRHSITSSARASSVGGTVRLSALAVLRLITKSNFVGCSTGRSAGLAPFKIRPT